MFAELKKKKNIHHILFFFSTWYTSHLKTNQPELVELCDQHMLIICTHLNAIIRKGAMLRE